MIYHVRSVCLTNSKGTRWSFRFPSHALHKTKSLASISCALPATRNRFWRHLPPVVHLTNARHQIEEERRKVHAPSVFTGLVIKREGVVVVVVALAYGAQGDEQVLRRVDVLVVRFVPVEMRPAVHAPCSVQHSDVTQHTAHQVGVPESLAPEVPWQHRGYNHRHEIHGRHVKSGAKIKIEKFISLSTFYI